MARLPRQFVPSLRKVVGVTLTNYDDSPATTASIAFSVQNAEGRGQSGTPTAGAECGVARVQLIQVAGSDISGGITVATATSGASVTKLTSATSTSATALNAFYECVMGAAGSIVLTVIGGDAGEQSQYHVRITAGGSTVYAGLLTVGNA